jgi:hypothetical protein
MFFYEFFHMLRNITRQTSRAMRIFSTLFSVRKFALTILVATNMLPMGTEVWSQFEPNSGKKSAGVVLERHHGAAKSQDGKFDYGASRLVDPSELPRSKSHGQADAMDIEEIWQAIVEPDTSLFWQHVSHLEFFLLLQQGEELGEHVQSMLTDFGLSVVRKSLHPDLSNHWVLRSTGDLPISAIKELASAARGIPEVIVLEPSPIVTSFRCPTNDPGAYDYSNGSGLQWGMWTTMVDSVWCYYTGGSSNWTAIVDSGTDWYHEDLYNTAWYGYDYADYDFDPTPPPGAWGQQSENEHGTHVAGIVGASTNNGIGVAGTSSDTLFIAKVKSDATTGSSLSPAAILDALNDIATISEIRVVNLSFGTPVASITEQLAINNCWNAGKVVVAAAGNDAVSAPFYPASFSNCISVSSLGLDSDYNYAFANYSNFGSTISLCAPGGSGPGQGPPADFGRIYSTFPESLWESSYGHLEGTSMAAPLVAGVANLLFASNPLLSNVQARAILESQTFDFGSPGFDFFYGNGVVCAWCAYEEACFQFSNSIVANDQQICPGEAATLSATHHPDISYQWFKNGVAMNAQTSSTLSVTQPGVYSLESTSVGGCVTYSNNLPISYVAQPNAQFTYNSNQNVISFTNQSTSSISYEWNFGDGSSTNAINPTHSFDPGTYTVILTAFNSCGQADIYSMTIVVSGTTWNPELDVASAVLVGENPSIAGVTVTSRLQGVRLRVYDSVGREIANQLLTMGTERLGNTWNPGQYLLVFELPSGTRKSVRHTIVSS